MTKNIFVTRIIPEKGLNMLREKGWTVDMYEGDVPLTHDALLQSLKQKSYDAVLCLWTDKIDSSVFDAAPQAKMYANYATGFDNIDLVEAKKRGISASNAPASASSEAVAEHTIALMFSLAMRVVEADAFVRAGKYIGWDPMYFIGTDIAGKTLGLIGAGHIGERVAHYATALGMKIIYSDVKKNENMEKNYSAQYLTRDEVIAQADIVSLHVPLLESTHHLINEQSLKQMKPTALLINTARGAVIDEKALAAALQAKVIRGAALDVYEFEPKPAAELLQLSNVILTPHIGSASEQARNEMSEIAASNIIDFLEGRTPRNIL